MAANLGDFSAGQNINIFWNSYNSLGAPVTRSQGTIYVIKNNSTTSNLFGVTDTLNFGSVTGQQLCRISSASSAFYANGNDYAVILSGDSIDGQFITATLGVFSLLNRADSIATYAELLSAPTADGPTRAQMYQWTYQLSRTTVTQTATQSVIKSSKNSSIATSATTDVGGTFTRSGYV